MNDIVTAPFISVRFRIHSQAEIICFTSLCYVNMGHVRPRLKRTCPERRTFSVPKDMYATESFVEDSDPGNNVMPMMHCQLCYYDRHYS